MAGPKNSRKKKRNNNNSRKNSHAAVSPVESPSPLREAPRARETTNDGSPDTKSFNSQTSISDIMPQSSEASERRHAQMSQAGPDFSNAEVLHESSESSADPNSSSSKSPDASEVVKELPLFDIHSREASNPHTTEPLSSPRIDDNLPSNQSGMISEPKLTLGSPFRIAADRKTAKLPSNILSQFDDANIQLDEDIDLDELEDIDEAQVVSAIPVKLASKEPSLSADPMVGSTPDHQKADPEPLIPQKSIARSIQPESIDLLQARHQTLGIAKPVMVESPATSEFDPDQYFSGSEDEIVTMDCDTTPKNSPNGKQDLNSVKSSPCRVNLMTASPKKLTVSPQAHKPLDDPKWVTEDEDENEIHDDIAEIAMPTMSDNKFVSEFPELSSKNPDSSGTTTSAAVEPAPEPAPKSTIRKVDTDLELQIVSPEPVVDRQEVMVSNGLASPLSSPQRSPKKTLSENPQHTMSSPQKNDLKSSRNVSDLDQKSPSKLDKPQRKSWLNFGSTPKLVPPKSRRISALSSVSAQSSPRTYKYAQSPLPTEINPFYKPEPPIFGVGVVGFHHKRGPEVEYWVGPEGSSSNMWPYLPFQSLPDGSHQFEENISYFTLLYDRNRATSTSLTFTRDDEGHIQAGTSDFRNVTTLFGIACSRQVKLSDLDSSQQDNSEYTRSVVQKSVFVIASKPIFGPIKEKLTVVTRSYFDQCDFSDRRIIDNFYDNLVQMPLWINENDLQVGMNLQRFVHDFGDQVLVLLKAALLECKILFYANDTDVLGTTQFALISLIPDLINHLQDSGSPLLSSYELNLQTPTYFKTSDRQSVLKYCGFPLQIFAGGGVFSPFIPLQQFDDLRQPETRYGMMGTTNNLFLDSDIDFNVVVNIETNKVDIRDPQLASLLKLTEADRAFMHKIHTDVNRAWDVEDRWHPQALGYFGGEDYIRHEVEEYLLALVASAKQATLQTRQETPNSSKSDGSTGHKGEVNSVHSNTSTPVLSNLAAWNKEWVSKWTLTNNFRIFDKSTDFSIPDLVSTEHPGIKLIKPSGMDRLWGFFRRSQPPGTNSSENLTTLTKPARSQASSAVNTPKMSDGCDEKFEPSTPNQGIR